MHRHLWTKYYHHRIWHIYKCVICGKLWGWKEKEWTLKKQKTYYQI